MNGSAARARPDRQHDEPDERADDEHCGDHASDGERFEPRAVGRPEPEAAGQQLREDDPDPLEVRRGAVRLGDAGCAVAVEVRAARGARRATPPDDGGQDRQGAPPDDAHAPAGRRAPRPRRRSGGPTAQRRQPDPAPNASPGSVARVMSRTAQPMARTIAVAPRRISHVADRPEHDGGSGADPARPLRRPARHGGRGAGWLPRPRARPATNESDDRDRLEREGAARDEQQGCGEVRLEGAAVVVARDDEGEVTLQDVVRLQPGERLVGVHPGGRGHHRPEVQPKAQQRGGQEDDDGVADPSRGTGRRRRDGGRALARLDAAHGSPEGGHAVRGPQYPLA